MGAAWPLLNGRALAWLARGNGIVARILHHVGPGNMTVVRLPGPETLNDLGPSARGVK